MSKYYAYRYFLINPVQQSLFKPMEKEKVAQELIKELQAAKIWSEDKKCVLYYIKSLYENTYLLKLGKHVKSKKYSPEPNDIYEVDIQDNYPYVSIIFNTDCNQQIILIDQNTRIFKNTNDSIAKFQSMIKAVIKRFGYVIKIQPITDYSSFWRSVDESDGISELHLELNSPNLFGASYETNKFMQSLKQLYNNESLNVKLANSDDQLKVNKQDMGDVIEYIGEGGGRWTLKRIMNGIRSTIKSNTEENIKSAEICVDKDDVGNIKGKVIEIDDFYKAKHRKQRENGDVK